MHVAGIDEVVVMCAGPFVPMGQTLPIMHEAALRKYLLTVRLLRFSKPLLYPPDYEDKNHDSGYSVPGPFAGWFTGAIYTSGPASRSVALQPISRFRKEIGANRQVPSPAV
jgi:hypothetical protein